MAKLYPQLFVITLIALLSVSCASVQQSSISGTIEVVAAEYGNLETSFVQSDLDKLGLVKGDRFSATHNNKTFAVTLGMEYGDVPRGDWIAFLNWEGKMRLARNLENAAETLGAKANDVLTLSR